MKLKQFGPFLLATIAALSLQCNKADGLLAGVKTTGMAATSVAHPVDAFGGVYNPSNITTLCDRLDLGISWVNTNQGAYIRDLPDYSGNATLLTLTGGLNPSDLNGYRDGAKTADTYVPEFGIVKKWKCGYSPYDMPMELSTGFIVYNRNDLKTTYGKAFELFGTSPTGLEYIHETAGLLLAARFCEMHSFGIAINYNVQRLKIDGLEGFANTAFSTKPTKTTNRGYNYSGGAGVILGYLFEWKCINIGASWQPKTSMRRFDKYSGFVVDNGAFDLPERFQTGIAYSPICGLTVAFDYEYIKWCDIPQLLNHTFPNLQNNLLGSKGGAGFAFDNQSFYRVGFEYELNPCWTVRAGFRHANSPVTSEWTAVNILTLDAMENVVTFGFTWRFNRCHELSMFYGLGMSKTVRGKNSIPTQVPQYNPNTDSKVFPPINADPTVFANSGTLVQADGNVDIKQRRCALGISWGWYY
ncbi:MAG: outer membrane protein transport protein [Chlamydiota bacterium]|nr:outer membrane protein transport protein [Chlamydiota bacterium]